MLYTNQMSMNSFDMFGNPAPSSSTNEVEQLLESSTHDTSSFTSSNAQNDLFDCLARPSSSTSQYSTYEDLEQTSLTMGERRNSECSKDSGCSQMVANYGDKTSEEYRIKRKRNNEAVKKARQKFNVKNVQVQKRLEVLRAEHEVLVLQRNQIRSNYELMKSVYEDALRAADSQPQPPVTYASAYPDAH